MPIISFQSIPMERVWGGRQLATEYGRALLDAAKPYGESWEMVDREDEQSVVMDGAYAGLTLHDLWQSHRVEVFGSGFAETPRFPLLIKILDAKDDLSIQVHPPAVLAAELGGEPKTEMWYIAKAEPNAKLYVGLRSGVTRESFQTAIETGTVADQLHAITVQAGDSIFIPSGRLHAIGAGLLIFEIQQNSDTTYRVFDWNRVGLDGKARELHVAESLASIDFSDTEPVLDVGEGAVIAQCEHFVVERFVMAVNTVIVNAKQDRFSLLHVVEGTLVDQEGRVWQKGATVLLPCGKEELTATAASVVLRTHIP